jgi:hypothetical protein
LLFAVYEFIAQLHVRPASWAELFDFLRFAKTKSLLRERAMTAAKQARE